MNYYKRHIGDYAAATRHLSLLEHGAYCLMLDLYYTSERPLPADEKAVQRLVGARSKEEREAVSLLLHEFFTLSDDGWRQFRCDEEIAKKVEKSETNRAVGALGGRPRKITQTVTKQKPNGYETETETVSENNPSHKPLATSHLEEPPNPPPDKPAAKRSRPRSSIGVTELPDEWRLYAASELPGWDLDGLFRSFRDHHLAKATMAADWPATWRTWVGNAPEFSRRFAPGGIVQGGQVRIAGGFVA